MYSQILLRELEKNTPQVIAKSGATRQSFRNYRQFEIASSAKVRQSALAERTRNDIMGIMQTFHILILWIETRSIVIT